MRPWIVPQRVGPALIVLGASLWVLLGATLSTDSARAVGAPPASSAAGANPAGPTSITTPAAPSDATLITFTVLGFPPVPPSPVPPARPLPTTGTDVLVIAAVGAGMVLAGVLIRRKAARLRRAPRKS